MSETAPTRPSHGPGSASSTEEPTYVSGVADGNLTNPMELRDFLTGVSVLFRLDRKRPTRPRRTKSPRPALRKPVLLAVAAATIAVLSFVALRGSDQVPKALPPTVVGEWRTAHPRYASRALWLGDSTITFGTGELATQVTVHPIKQVRQRVSRDTTYLSIDYLAGGQIVTWPIVFVGAAPPRLWFVHQPEMKWSRVGRGS